MAEDYLKTLPVERVAAWYRRLATAWSNNAPDLQPALAGTFLRTWVDNRNPKTTIEFDAPSHLKECSAVFDTLAFHRDVFLTDKKARLPKGVEKWVGVLPRIQGLPGFPKWNLTGPLSLEYESLCDIAPDIWAIGRIQRSGTAAERDIFGSLRGFQLKSAVTVMAQRPPQGGINVMFSMWDCSATDRYDWNYSERLTVANPDYQSRAPDAIRPQDQTLTVYHSNARRLEDAAQAAPYNVALRRWRITDARIAGPARIDPSRRL